jgi:hypothetical protein
MKLSDLIDGLKAIPSYHRVRTTQDADTVKFKEPAILPFIAPWPGWWLSNRKFASN